METIFVLMIMYSFYLFGVGISKMIKISKRKRRLFMDSNIPKEVWENNIEDVRYHAK